MKLRDHPLMSHHRVRNWPPVWVEKFAVNKTLKGEIGVLEHVGDNPAGDDKLYLHITYENKSYVGCLIFDDPGFCALIGNLLKKHINKSIEEIGSLDLAHTL
jgi:hypothetical protein